nr:translation initiation factor IF-2-like [Marmota flaviventris]
MPRALRAQRPEKDPDRWPQPPAPPPSERPPCSRRGSGLWAANAALPRLGGPPEAGEYRSSRRRAGTARGERPSSSRARTPSPEAGSSYLRRRRGTFSTESLALAHAPPGVPRSTACAQAQSGRVREVEGGLPVFLCGLGGARYGVGQGEWAGRGAAHLPRSVSAGKGGGAGGSLAQGGPEPQPVAPAGPWGDVEARVGATLQPEAWAAVRTAALRGGEARGAKGRCQGLGAARPGRRRLLSGRASELSGIPGAVRVTAQGEGELRLVPGSPGGKMEATTKMAAHVKLDPTQHPHLRSSHPFHREPASWVQHPQGFSTLDLGHHGGAPVTHSSQVWILPLVLLYPRDSVEFSFVGS